jgi:DNA-binding transcriptional LysR family regulator
MDWADRIGRRIRLRDLHIVLAVAERGSMAKAAEHLAISHPVVSKTISDLEQTVGVRLFDRNSQGVELTTYGRALLKCGVTVFDEMRQGLKQIEFLAHPDSGELAIGCSDITMAGLLPAIAERFSIQHPGIRLHVIHADTAMLQFHALRERNVELLIGRMPRMSVNDDLVVETLFDEPFVVVCGIRSRWARRRNIALADLVNAPWILPPYDSVPGSLILEIFCAKQDATSARQTRHLVRASHRHSYRNRAICWTVAQFRRTIQRFARGVENTSDGFASPACCNCYHHRQESHTPSFGRAFYRLRKGNYDGDHRADKAAEKL